MKFDAYQLQNNKLSEGLHGNPNCKSVVLFGFVLYCIHNVKNVDVISKISFGVTISKNKTNTTW